MVSVNRNIVRYNKYLVAVTVVVVLSVIVIVIVISLEHILQSLSVCSSSSSSTLFILFLEKKSLIVLGLFHYKCCGEYLLCGRLQWERTVVESLNFLTL